MKKFVKLVAFSLLIVFPLSFCLAGCGGKKFEDVWTYDEDYHWHASVDKNSSEIQDKGEHIMSDWIDDVDANLEDSQRYKQCEVCGYKIYEPLVASQGLELTLPPYGPATEYYVEGIGTCTDTTIRIPETYNGLPVTRLWHSCFKDATNVKCVVIPDSVIYINNWAFENCTSLERVVFGKCSNCFEASSFNSVFNGCTSLKNIIVDEENQEYKSIDGNVYSKDGKEMVYYPRGKVEDSFTILNTVETIRDYCFANCKLKTVTIPDSVKTIGQNAFRDCANLEKVDLGNGVEIISSNAFFNSTIESIIIPASVTVFGNSCFSNCGKFTIYYKGSVEDWGKIDKQYQWDNNTDITIEYNYTGLGN